MFKGLENNFTSTLFSWYNANRRNLPWRGTNDPYKVWISEIILQQTRVEQGLPYYLRFIEKTPDVKSLAQMNEDELLLLWQGLGYYSRALNLQRSAKIIYHELNGQFPKSYIDLLKLPGIGPYTAAAISSFIYNEIQPVLDGNVYRFISRYFGIYSEINQERTRKEFIKHLDKLISKSDPGKFNQAIMEFGALQCVPKNPNCAECSFELNCFARKNTQVQVLPVKKKSNPKRNRYLNFLVIASLNKIVIEKRNNQEIWKNMYQFPLIETKSNDVLEFRSMVNTVGYTSKNTRLIHEENHLLSHQKLHVRFYEMELKESLISHQDMVHISSLSEYAFPQIIQKFIENHITLLSI
jgi:A/G-specific adenine glycosylase|tara:strand:+ start:2858 stop:3916 length:1059 start_codon:yes stop_codon:yes gene_type:complete